MNEEMDLVNKKAALEDLFRMYPAFEIVFTKVNGEERTMRCSRDAQILPPMTEKKNPKPENPDVFVVWDLDEDGFRSFRIDNLKAITIVYDIDIESFHFEKEEKHDV